MDSKILISDKDLNFLDIKKTLSHPITIKLDKKIKIDVEKSHNFVVKSLKQGKPIYGVNTGFGKLASITISNSDLNKLQRNLVLSHCVGVGENLPANIVRLILLLKIKSLSKGFSGISFDCLDILIKLLNHDILPCIPKKGSVGASGDLAPLAHMASILIGVGDAIASGSLLPAKKALKLVNLKPVDLKAKEGLALLNGTQVSTAIALAGLFETKNLFDVALISGSLSVVAANGSHVPFDSKIHTLKLSKGQRKVAETIHKLLKSESSKNNKPSKIQDPYSLRCQPQVMGACLDQITFVEQQLLAEANSVSDNPLIFTDEKQILTGGNFHAQSVAFAADNLALAIAEIGSLSERRIALLMDANFSGLPSFLVKDSGLNSGLMIAQVTAAALASENKQLAIPRSIDSMPTSANQEDHVSMATNAANRLLLMTENLSYILAIELLSASQGVELGNKINYSAPIKKFINLIRSKVEFISSDRYFAKDIEELKKAIIAGEFN